MACTRLRSRLSIGGGVLLMSAAVCFAWWSDNKTALATSPGISVNEKADTIIHQTSLSPLLRLLSFMFCLIGGFLPLFGFLWFVKVNRQMSSGYRQWNRSTSYPNTMEQRANYRHSDPNNLQACLYSPLCEELNCTSVMMMPTNSLLIPVASEDPALPPSYEKLTGTGRIQLLPCSHVPSNSALPQREQIQTLQKEELRPGSLTSAANSIPPPSYNNIHLHV
ncbi:transmembrane protein 61-like [Hypanus sabinus]|uniref:transmembrane protein 61-like n=1 Tax=Hypanus sabinus TaxID=79690 RepID=UPI0028C4031D|nr:transmembrane protein 61-like [Hypanus sabinus]XP_059839560.1 transmembrane protein 61-like [Hypanus sabinus]